MNPQALRRQILNLLCMPIPPLWRVIYNMNLIVPAELCEPPSEALMFRHLLMVSKYDLLYSNLLFCQEDMVDLYYHYLKSKYLFDFVDDIVTQREKGYFLKVSYIRTENINNILENIRAV